MPSVSTLVRSQTFPYFEKEKEGERSLSHYRHIKVRISEDISIDYFVEHMKNVLKIRTGQIENIRKQYPQDFSDRIPPIVSELPSLRTQVLELDLLTKDIGKSAKDLENLARHYYKDVEETKKRLEVIVGCYPELEGAKNLINFGKHQPELYFMRSVLSFLRRYSNRVSAVNKKLLLDFTELRIQNKVNAEAAQAAYDEVRRHLAMLQDDPTHSTLSIIMSILQGRLFLSPQNEEPASWGAIAIQAVPQAEEMPKLTVINPPQSHGERIKNTLEIIEKNFQEIEEQYPPYVSERTSSSSPEFPSLRTQVLELRVLAKDIGKSVKDLKNPLGRYYRYTEQTSTDCLTQLRELDLVESLLRFLRYYSRCASAVSMQLYWDFTHIQAEGINKEVQISRDETRKYLEERQKNLSNDMIAKYFDKISRRTKPVDDYDVAICINLLREDARKTGSELPFSLREDPTMLGVTIIELPEELEEVQRPTEKSSLQPSFSPTISLKKISIARNVGIGVMMAVSIIFSLSLVIAHIIPLPFGLCLIGIFLFILALFIPASEFFIYRRQKNSFKASETTYRTM